MKSKKKYFYILVLLLGIINVLSSANNREEIIGLVLGCSLIIIGAVKNHELLSKDWFSKK